VTALQFEIKQRLCCSATTTCISSDIARQMEDSLRTIATIKKELMEK
jgi:hypothetical protein